MSQSRTETRRFRLALAALALAALGGASAPTPARGSPPAAAQPLAIALSRTDSPLAAAPTAQAGASCWVYPITFHERILQESPTGGPGPAPMPDPAAPIQQIPAASRFQVRFSVTPYQGFFLSWTGDQTTAALEAALAGGGTLGDGLFEASPPAGDPGAGRLVNGVLEAGDWLTAANPQISGGIADALDRHIEQRTFITLPVFNVLMGSGSLPIVRASQFIRVRLIGYNLAGTNRYLEFGLVSGASPYACFQYQTPLLVGQSALITPSMPLSATLERSWDFGDGSPASAALTPTHAYAQPGAYTVTLTLPHTPTLRAVGRIEVVRPVLPPQVFLPATLRRSAP